jgi:hypothetical protein
VILLKKEKPYHWGYSPMAISRNHLEDACPFWFTPSLFQEGGITDGIFSSDGIGKIDQE